jgi:hypothetical protein
MSMEWAAAELACAWFDATGYDFPDRQRHQTDRRCAMSYASIDPIIERWAKAHAKQWFSMAWAEKPARFLYHSNSVGECYQISLGEPKNGATRVHLWSIERYDKDEVHFEWRPQAVDLERVLDLVLEKIEALGSEP